MTRHHAFPANELVPMTRPAAKNLGVRRVGRPSAIGTTLFPLWPDTAVAAQEIGEVCISLGTKASERRILAKKKSKGIENTGAILT
jgi:hypothetical protein